MKIKILVFVLLVFCASANAYDRQVPLFFGYRAALVDEGGNLLADGPSDVKFQILESDGAALYEEEQTLDVVNGYVSAIVGNGQGGISPDVFDPQGARYLQVTVSGQRPYDPLQIVATPYAIWSEMALRMPDEAVTSGMIADGAIKKEHLNEELSSAIFPNGIPKDKLPSDTVYGETLQSSYGAGEVGVATVFIYSGASTVQGVLKDFDIAIKKRQEEIEFTKKDYDAKINNEVAARQVSDAALQAQDAALQGQHNLQQGQLDSQQNQISAHTQATTAVHGVEGEVVGTESIQSLTNKSITGSTIVNPTITGGGVIKDDMNVATGKKIDSVDISALYSDVNSHKNSNIHAFAFGRVYFSKTGTDPCKWNPYPTVKYNIKSVELDSGQGGRYKIYFNDKHPQSPFDYIVVATPMVDNLGDSDDLAVVYGTTMDYFKIYTANGASGGGPITCGVPFSFLVFNGL